MRNDIQAIGYSALQDHLSALVHDAQAYLWV